INPYGSLLLNGTTLYGTTRLGGSKGNGTVFQINTDGTGYARIYDFQGGNDAAKPFDTVILIDNTLYGMTEAGGNCGDGAIFALVPPS
ncbi:MAG: choice-of-anchor tandem repeat GloVer-containing protein, partial [Candidatus Binatus sp.]